MNIIFATREQAAEMTARYIVLELDTFQVPEHGCQISWCVLDPASVPMTELWMVDSLRQQHGQALAYYQQAQWEHCLEILAGLRGRWASQLDSFYAQLESRVQKLQQDTVPAAWDGSLEHA